MRERERSCSCKNYEYWEYLWFILKIKTKNKSCNSWIIYQIVHYFTKAITGFLISHFIPTRFLTCFIHFLRRCRNIFIMDFQKIEKKRWSLKQHILDKHPLGELIDRLFKEFDQINRRITTFKKEIFFIIPLFLTHLSHTIPFIRSSHVIIPDKRVVGYSCIRFGGIRWASSLRCKYWQQFFEARENHRWIIFRIFEDISSTSQGIQAGRSPLWVEFRWTNHTSTNMLKESIQ